MQDLIVKLLFTRLPFVAVLAIAVVHVTYKTSAGNAATAERASAARHEIITQHGLVGEEVVFFDQCQPFIKKQVVRALHTDKFCGCMAKRGTGEFFPEHKSLAMKFLEPLVLRQQFNGAQANALVPEAATRGSRINAARDVLAGINSCQDAK
jgi:hypothetical protein